MLKSSGGREKLPPSFDPDMGRQSAMASRDQTPSPSQYASNGLEMLQAASDAAQAIDNPQALQDAAVAVAAVEAVSGPDLSSLEPGSVSAAAAAAAAVAAHAAVAAAQAPAQLALGPGAVRDPTINPKLTRLRRACDMCSMRKVKCDDSSIPCRPCRELGVDCTYDRETKRRGPPNKHAEAAKAAKRARVELAASPSAMAAAAVAATTTTTTTATTTPSTTTTNMPLHHPSASLSAVAIPQSSSSPSPHNAAKTLVSISADAAVDADAIAPLPVLEHLVDDFFTYVHPLAPFPHEPTFRQSFANREDRTRPEFLGLLAAMVAALVASFPRSAHEHLKAQHSPQLFPRPVTMVDRCRDVALLTRGSRWVLKQPKTLDDAATSYFLGLASAYVGQWNASRHFLAETLTLMRELGFARPKHPGHLPTFGNDAYSDDPLPFNHVKDQIGKRIFWCLLLAVRSFSQLGASHTPTDLVIAPSTPSLPYPAYPDNVDDICVLANQVIHQPEGSVTLLTGFRFAMDIYTTMNGVVSLELAYGMSTLPWADQRLLLRDGLVAAKSIVDNLPPQLQLRGHHDHVTTTTTTNTNNNANDDENDDDDDDGAGLEYVPPAWPNPQPDHDVRALLKAQPLRRRRLQLEIQKANILVSQLATRSYFVQLYFTLRDVHLGEQPPQTTTTTTTTTSPLPSDDDNDDDKSSSDKEMLHLMSQERDLLVQNLFTIVTSLSQRTMEPNGGALISKLRRVALALLSDPPDRKGPFSLKADEALAQLVDALSKLATHPSTSTATAIDENHQQQQQQQQQRPMMTAGDELDELRHWAELRDFQLRFAAGMGFADLVG
ncbi:hypothetical protein CDD80_5224 [Ophiocordyceps camponoti-rufipedis]|uniref:Zn(2)-C6 fungal-type domain-containing protein n=1 Tax=Ophiocordyceps camponoti-rufipedis TaxID=2004952 RepID=A0A2C5Y096_9HYPO|nr:hypothetical protein CDD80_5224 [Ophiocordyceps camponoti-rufipedis]